MRRLAPLLVLALSTAVLLSACSSGGSSASAPASDDGEGAFALDATWATVGGESIDAGDLDGQAVAAWFWAPW